MQRLIPSALLLLAIAVVGVAAVSSQEAGRPPRDPQQAQRDLARLEAQIADLENRLEALGERRTSLVAEWEAADIRLALSRRELSLARLRLDVITDQLAELEREVARLEEDLDTAREELADRVVGLYRMGPLSYTRLLLAARSTDDVIAGYQLVNRLAAQDRSLVQSLRRRIEARDEAVAAMRGTRERLDVVRAEETETVARLEREQSERQALIRRLDVETASQRRMLERQQEDAVELERLVARLESPPSSTTGAANVAPFAASRGQLPWPGEGEVTLGFGRQRHPVYDTYTLSKGIEIAAEAGSPVTAVFPGRVVFADWFQSYGLVVIVSHGDEYFTIYGHLSRVDAGVGDDVGVGEQLGLVGDTGSLTGPSLYFEVREGMDALNPRSWLRSR